MNEDMYDEEIFYCEELLSFYTLLRAKIIYHLRTGGNFSLGEDLACGDNFRENFANNSQLFLKVYYTKLD